MTRDEQNFYREYMKAHLPNGRDASGGREVNCRCLYHDDHSRHMYLSVPQKDGDPTLFYCQKCQARGVVTPTKLNEWNIYDDEIAAILLRHSKTVTSRTNKYSNRTTYILSNAYINDDDLSKTKLAYINERLGTALTYDDCCKMKICLNLNDLLNSNHIRNLTRNESIVNELDINFVGFISLDNAFVNLRRIVPEGKVYQSIDKRYVNYSIFGKYDNLERFYTIPTAFNAFSPERIKLHIAEGPFDILSIYLNVRQREPGIYTCIAGNNYMGIIKHFMLSMKLFHIEIHLYPDKPTEKDRSGDDDHMQNIADMCKPIGIPVYIHRNTYGNEKDFGVSPDKIRETIYTL